MKKFPMLLLVSLSPFALAACGSDAKEPVEQIIVREPGVEAVAVAADDSSNPANLVAAGSAAFAACSACHSAVNTEGSGIGPNLGGVFGRTAGALEEYSYSEALAAADFVWDTETLDAFLANPSAKVPGTRMMTGAVQDDERRAAIVAYLASLSQ